jgi:hypothetical protein
MAGYIGSKAVSVNTTSATITGDASIGGNVTLNDGSADVDFRVESNVSGDTHALFVDGATGHVGLGTSVLGAQFNVKGTGAVDAGIGSTNAGGAYLYLDGDSNGDFSGSDYSFIGHQTDGQLIINQDSPSGTQALLIKTAGTLAATISSSGINLADGNLTVATGHGIDFAAQTASSATGVGASKNELLDHYEQGTFTPIFLDGSGNQTNYGHAVGFYVKVGARVHAHGYLAVGNSLQSASGNVQLGGLPFPAVNITNGHNPVNIGWANSLNITAGQNLGGYLAPNTSLIQVHLWDAATGTTELQFSELSVNGTLMFFISYNAV